MRNSYAICWKEISACFYFLIYEMRLINLIIIIMAVTQQNINAVK